MRSGSDCAICSSGVCETFRADTMLNRFAVTPVHAIHTVSDMMTTGHARHSAA